MKKKLKIAIPFAVLTLTCGISAGVLAGCNAHEHNYSDWKIDGEEHVRVCPEDGATDESTRAKHEFFGGECEVCGADQNAGKVFSTASGQIKLHKLGGYVTDYTGITIDMGDDDVQADLDTQTGKFTIEDAVVGKTYNLKISKAGYKDYSTLVKVAAGKDTVIGGANGAVLEYEAFVSLCDYDNHLHDYSHVNDENPTIGVNGDGSKSLDIISTDKYSDVSVTLKAKNSNGGNIQGIVLGFEDGSYAIFNLHTGQRDLQFRPNLFSNNKWGSVWGIKNDPNQDINTEGNDKWIEYKQVVTDSDLAKFNGEGLEVTLVRKGGTLYAFIDGRYINQTDLPADRADDEVKVGFFSHDAKENAVWSYKISDSVPEMECNLNINVTQPDGAGCSVTKSSGDDVFALTDTVELTFNAPEGYRLAELTVAGEDRYGDVVGGKLTIATNRLNLDVEAVFTEMKDVALEITVKGNKLGETYNLAKDTTVTFKNTDYSFTVGENGVISNSSVTEGRYTVVVDGYFEKEINFTEGFNEVTLEYNTFKQLLGWGDFNFDNQNAETPSFGINNDCAVVLTNDTYGTVMSSIYLKGNNQNAGNGGLVFRFVGNGMADNGEAVTITMQGTKKVQFSKDGLWGNVSVATGLEWKNLLYFVDCYDDDAQRVADAHAQEYLDSYNAGTLKLSVLRDGATFYVYLNDRFVGVQTVDAKYADAKCEVGFLSAGLGNTTEWKYWNVDITEDVPARQVATLTNGTTDTNGTVTLPTGEVKVGDTVQLTVAPATGYLIKKLTVGGVDVTSTLTVDKDTKAGTCSVEIFGNATVVAEFEQIIYGSVESAVSLHKSGTTTALANGTEVTLSNSDFTYKATVTDGKINLAQVATGTYTVSTAGAVNETITVTEDKYATAIVFEYVAYTCWVGYDNDITDYSQINDEQSIIKVNGHGSQSLDIISTDKYTDMTATITAKDSNANPIQGIVIQFADGKAAIFNIKTDQSLVQFRNEMWGHDSVYGDVWKESAVGTVTQADIDKYNADGVEVKLVRYEGTLYCYVDGRQVYSIELPEAYKNQEAQVGFFAQNVKANAEWKIGVSTEIPSDLTTPATPDTNA